MRSRVIVFALLVVAAFGVMVWCAGLPSVHAIGSWVVCGPPR